MSTKEGFAGSMIRWASSRRRNALMKAAQQMFASEGFARSMIRK
jgi:hypothetical protein